MLQITLALMLHTISAAAGGQDYATAYKEHSETGQPLVVLIGADWCPGCRQMKYTAIPELEKKGGLSKVSYAYVNYDQHRDLAGKLMRGGSIPQLVMFQKTPSGWKRQQLTGAQGVTDIQSFLQAGVVAPVGDVSSN